MATKYIDYEFYRGRGYKMLLYSDNPQHMRVLHQLRKHPDYSRFYCGCWHIQYDDLGNEIIVDTGKKHAHIIVRHENPVYWRSFCSSLGADPRFCMPVCCDINNQGKFVVKSGSNVERGLVYMTHIAYPEKEQYSVNQFFGSSEMIDRARAAVDRYLSRNLSMADCAFYIAEWISDYKGILTAIEFMRWVSTTPYFKAVQNPLVRAVWNEHNDREYKLMAVERDRLAYMRKQGISVSGTVAKRLDLSEFHDIDDFPIDDNDDGGLLF